MPMTYAPGALDGIPFFELRFYVTDNLVPSPAPLGRYEYFIWCCRKEPLKNDVGRKSLDEVDEKIQVLLVFERVESLISILFG